MSKITGGKFANGALTAAFSAALRSDWGTSKSNGQRGYSNGPANLTEEQRADIDSQLKALQTDLDKLNKEQYFKDSDHAAAWLHEKVHPLAMKYDIEFGARIFEQFGMNGQYSTIGNVITDYQHDQIIDMRRSTFGSLRPVADWHSHGASSVSYTDPTDLTWANNNNAISYLSTGSIPGRTVMLQKYQDGKVTNLAGRLAY